MSEPKYGLLAIGNALVDVLSQTDENFIAKNGLEKGAMTHDRCLPQRILHQPDGAGSRTGIRRFRRQYNGGFAGFGGKGVHISASRARQSMDVFRHDVKARAKILYN